MKRPWIFIAVLGGCILGLTPLVFSAPESGPVPILESSQENLNLGSLSFFLDKKNPTRGGESVHLQEKDGAYFCLTLNHQDPRLRRAIKYLRGVEITLESSGLNPQRLVGSSRWRNRALNPDTQGCFVGFVRVPYGTQPGRFQVTEIDLWQTSGRSISFRPELGLFSPLGSLEIESPMTDHQAPIVEKIVTYTPLVSRLHLSGNRAWTDIYFRVITTDLISGIKPDSFRLFMKVFVDGNRIDIVEPHCVPRLSNRFYDCHLYFSRAAPHLKSRSVKLVLDSISVTDKAGNDIEITNSAQLSKLTEGKLLRYTIDSAKPLQEGSSGKDEDQEEVDQGDLMQGDPQAPKSDGDSL